MTSKKSVALKESSVKKLAEKIKNSKTLMIVSISGLPSKQFQEIKKTIREHALVRVAKKNIMIRTITEFGKQSIFGLEKYIKENCAFVISDIDGFELARILSQKKNPVFAKAGQVAPEDIEVKKGPTDLVPGPAISELGSLGLQVAVEEGKISIKNSKVIVNQGQEINENAASILRKLNIQPFNIGLEPLVIYNVENEKIYTDIKIDSEEAVAELRNVAVKALGFAQKIMYYCKETIGYFLAKANSEEGVLNKLVSVQDTDNSSQNKETEKESREKQVDETQQESIEEQVEKQKEQAEESTATESAEDNKGNKPGEEGK